MKIKALRWLLLALLATGIGLSFYYRDQLATASLQQWIQPADAAAPFLFIAIYAIATLVFLPGSVLTLAGGALFGPVLGTLYNLTGATIGALLAFLLSRYLASAWVEQKTGGRLKQLKQGVEKEGWRFVAFVRLVPLFPFNLLNYALGLTRIRLSHYLVASYVCMLPGATAYTYLGYAGREALAGGESQIQKALLALALLAIALFLPRLISHFRLGPSLSIAELYVRLKANTPLLLVDVRSKSDYAGEAGKIGSSLNIPLEQLESRLPELTPWQQKSIVLICTTDRRSKMAAQVLGRQGFTDVQVVSGGMTQWNRDRLPFNP